MIRPTNQSTYIPYIDGLRALAVMIVILFHLDIAVFQGGFIGVDIFFVISGFLITRIIANEIERKEFSFMDFYARRVKRIFPALFVMLWLSCLGAIVFFAPDEYGYHLKSLRMAAAQFSNFFFAGELDYFDSSGKNAALLHTWSLGVEEQFYFVWPLLLLGILGTKLRKVKGFLIGTLFISSLALSEYLLRHDAMQAFYMLHSRAWELAIGGILALNIIPKMKHDFMLHLLSYIGMALILAGCFLLDERHFPGLRALLPCLGVALIMYSAQNKDLHIHKMLSFAPIVFIGAISYSLYLWHWPIIIFYKTIVPGNLSFIAQVSILAASLVMGAASYYIVERPFRAIKPAPWKVLLCGVLVIAITLIGANILKKHSRASWRITAQIDKSISTPNQWVKECSVEGGAYNIDECVIGPNKNSYEVILTGDSHASHFIPTVLDWAQGKGLTVRLFMRGACKTWVKTDAPRFKAGTRDTYCEQLSKDFYAELNNNDDLRYIFLAQRGPTGDAEEILSLRDIKKLDAETVFLGAVPEFEYQPNTCYVRQNLFIWTLLPALKQQQKDCYAFNDEFNADLLNRVYTDFVPELNEIGVPYFDAAAYLSSPIDDAGRFMYMDDNHLNIHGAKHLVPFFNNFMDEHTAK
ncbi:MAG: acyltransferase family protein [Alphaproteobacteria bacterium]